MYYNWIQNSSINVAQNIQIYYKTFWKLNTKSFHITEKCKTIDYKIVQIYHKMFKKQNWNESL